MINKVCNHVIFFDGECALCHRAVRHILFIDQKKIFCFSPLNGILAKSILSKELQTINSLVLIEQLNLPKQKIWVRAKAVFRIYWLIGGKWKMLGFFSFFPSFLGDWVYKYIARHRHRLHIKKEYKMFEGKGRERFLP